MGTHHDEIGTQRRLDRSHSFGRVAGRDQKFTWHAIKMPGSYLLKPASSSLLCRGGGGGRNGDRGTDVNNVKRRVIFRCNLLRKSQCL